MPNDLGEISPLTLNRLSVYLRGLRQLQACGIRRISSQGFADRFHLSSAQIRKDLAHFGEFGIRGVGYDVDELTERLHRLLGLDDAHRLVIVGMGHLGSALANYLGFNDSSFQVVAGVDTDPAKVGTAVGRITIRPARDLAAVVREERIDIGVVAVPSDAAQQTYDDLVAAGVRTVLNFAPVSLREREEVRLKNVDFRIHLEELAFYLGLAREEAEG